jgi:hypothetical protein
MFARAPLFTRAMLVCAAATLLPHATRAQQPRARITGSIETGAAAVEQPLVRSGAAFYLAPGAQLSARDFTIGGDAVFATGTPVWQSFLGNGFIRSPAVKNIRILGSGQVLKTSGLLPTVHGDIGAEWRRGNASTSGVVRARAGRLSYGDALWSDMDIGASAIRTHGAMVFAVEGLYSNARRPAALREQLGVSFGAGDDFSAQTLDFTPRMIWERGRLRTDASVALRVVERGVDGTRAGPQLSFTFATARGISLFVGGAQRLPDVRAGIPSGRSALLGLRVGGTRLVTRPVAPGKAGPSLHIVNGALILDAGITAIARASLRGDFTEWQSRECAVFDRHRFHCGQAPRAGTWRVAVRLNNGAWQQPSNLAPAADDFGSVDGVLLTGGKP